MNDRLKFVGIRFAHRTEVQIRFSDYDTFGHINNNSYMAFLDLGKSEFFRAVMGCNCTPDVLSAVIVNIDVDFLSPSLTDEPLEVLTAVCHLGNRSFVLYQRVVNPATGDVKVQASTVLAGFDIATQSSAPLKPELVGRLEQHVWHDGD